MKLSNLTSLFLTVSIAGFISMGFISCSRTADTKAETTPAETLSEQLKTIYTRGGTMLGHHDDPVYGHSWCGDSGRSDIYETVGDYPAMMSWDLGGIELGHAENLDSVPFDRMAYEVRCQHERGGFNTFSWHLFSPVDSSDSWTIGDSLTVVKILTDSAVNSTFRTQLRSLAGFFNSLTDSDGNNIPVIFRPFHEHTGSWFWWGKPYASPEQYAGLWKLIKEEFDRAGVDNVLFAYSTDRISTEEEYLEYYPGDDMVDILGIDVYMFNGPDGIDEYRATTDNALSIINRLGRERDKIVAFTETGSETIPVENWWTEVLLPVLKNNNMSYVVIWRNAHDKPNHYYAPYPEHGSADSFRQFCNDSTILLIKDLK